MNLPLVTPTTAYMIGNLRSWVTYFWQRSSLHSDHAQKEHREQVADPVFELFRESFPIMAQLTEDGMSRYVTKDEWEIIRKIREASNI